MWRHHLSFTSCRRVSLSSYVFFHFAMSTEEETVFLEDIETQKSVNQGDQAPMPASQESNVSVSSHTKSNVSMNNKTSNAESKKRQATLTDMFGGQGAKRQKLASGSGTTTVVKAGASSTSELSRPNGLQKLNAIPFSLKAFQDSLNEEQQELLDLECQVLGRSWFAFTYQCTNSAVSDSQFTSPLLRTYFP